MRLTVTLLLVLLVSALAGQQDSTEINLRNYKDLFDKKLIDRREYKQLKARVLQLSSTNSVSSASRNKDNHNFNFRLEPVGYFGVTDFKVVAVSPSGPHSQIFGPSQNVGGLHFEAGPVVKNQFYPSFAAGLEGSRNAFGVPVYANFTAHILKTRFSPIAHVGMGYYLMAPTQVDYTTTKASNGCTGVAGIGFNANITRSFAMGLAFDYRFIFVRFTYPADPANGPPFTASGFYHQLGFRVMFIFS